MNERKAIISLIISTVLGVGMAFAGSQHGQILGAFPIFALCVCLTFLLNWLAFIPAYRLQTETFYDLIGSCSYVSVCLFALILTEQTDTRTLLLGGLVMIWAIRLGTFLFRRIHRSGKDDRFDSIKPSFIRFLNAWTLQALWAVFTASPAIIAITSAKRVAIDMFAIIGLVMWGLGFTIEVVADYQKTQFRKKQENKDQFISSGLWALSRHPNYFGEILLWTGVMVIAIPVLQGWQWIALISPIFVTLLLTKVSGVPMLEAKAEKKWGGQAEYETYKANTPVLIPKLW